MAFETAYLCFVAFNFCLAVAVLCIYKTAFDFDSLIDNGGAAMAFTMSGPLVYMIALALASVVSIFCLPMALCWLYRRCSPEARSAA